HRAKGSATFALERTLTCGAHLDFAAELCFLHAKGRATKERDTKGDIYACFEGGIRERNRTLVGDDFALFGCRDVGTDIEVGCDLQHHVFSDGLAVERVLALHAYLMFAD